MNKFEQVTSAGIPGLMSRGAGAGGGGGAPLQ